MEFPKKIMTSKELMAMGFKDHQLRRYAHVEGQTYATRIPGGRKILWDTEKFGKALIKYAAR